MMGLMEFLQWLQGPGINAAIGFILSFVVEWFPAWADLSPRAKRLAMLCFSLAIPVMAAVVSAALGYQDWSIEGTFWPAIVAGFASFSGATVAHVRKLDGE